MSGIPEGARTASGEGSDLNAAILAGAEELGLNQRQVGYKVDLSHFRSGTGGSIARTTVKVIVWEKPEADEEPEAVEEAPAAAEGEAAEASSDESEAPKKPRRPRRKKDDDVETAAPEAPTGTNAGSEAAAVWFSRLLELMSLQGEVTATGNDERVRIQVKVDKAGRLIGRRGSTLASVRHLLRLAISEHGDFIIDVDVADDRPREERSERSDRGDRGDRGDRRRGGNRRRGRREDRGPKGKYPEEKLQAIARRAAEKAVEANKAITINLELNSYDRRVVHLEVSDIDGVASQSIMKDDKKYVQILPELSFEDE
jgi:predicted RNA-binding protein Jag